ncbi:MAG: hypothetical protein AAGF97_05185 [Planctomycetota bacterium]
MALVFALGLVIWAMQKAARPQTWAWLFGGAQLVAVDDSEEDTDIDTRRPPAPLPAGVIQITPPSNSASPTSTGLFPGVDPAWLATLRDDTVFRADETSAWYGMLAAMQAATSAQLTEQGQGAVGFTQLYQQPDAYRGKLVRLQGTVKRCHYIEARDNPQKIPGYYQCWFWPTGSTNPVVLYCLTVPDDFPQGMSINEWVEVDGLFYKRWAYRAVDTIRIAPLVIAKRPAWQPSSADSAPTQGTSP